MVQSVPDIAWGKQTRVILDVGCGVASFGGYLFDRDVLAMSFAPKDEHEAQIQFALERGIPAISAVMGTKRLPYPGRVFDAVHCARCRVPWHIEGGHLICISSDRFKAHPNLYYIPFWAVFFDLLHVLISSDQYYIKWDFLVLFNKI